MFAPVRTATSARVVCARASPLVNRRRAFGVALVSAPLLSGRSALALLDYDDDEDMVEKAKANRAKRLKEVYISHGFVCCI
jgi:hypothetical protein